MSKSKAQSLRDAKKYRDQLRWNGMKKVGRESQVQKTNGSKSPKKSNKQQLEEGRRKARRWAEKTLPSRLADESDSGDEESSRPSSARKNKDSLEGLYKTFDDMSFNEKARADTKHGIKTRQRKPEVSSGEQRSKGKPKESRSTENTKSNDDPEYPSDVSNNAVNEPNPHQKAGSSPRTRTNTSYSFLHRDTNKINLAADRRRADEAKELKRKVAEQTRKCREEELSAKKKYEAEQLDKEEADEQ